jgi:uncharacterized protein with HEPN domain
VPADLRQRHPDIPWKAIAGLRDVIVHQYDELDIDAIHRTTTIDVQALIERLPRVIADLTPPSKG